MSGPKRVLQGWSSKIRQVGGGFVTGNFLKLYFGLLVG